MKCRFEDLNGKTLARIEGKINDDEMIFTTVGGEKYKLFYEQD